MQELNNSTISNDLLEEKLEILKSNKTYSNILFEIMLNRISSFEEFIILHNKYNIINESSNQNKNQEEFKENNKINAEKLLKILEEQSFLYVVRDLNKTNHILSVSSTSIVQQLIEPFLRHVYFQLINKETQFSITVTIRLLGLSNLKIISEMIQKSKSNTFYHIKELIQEGFIIEEKNHNVFDEKTKSRTGPKKYYQNSIITKLIFEQMIRPSMKKNVSEEIKKISTASDYDLKTELINQVKKQYDFTRFLFTNQLNAISMTNQMVEKLASNRNTILIDRIHSLSQKNKSDQEIADSFEFPKAEFNQWMDYLTFYEKSHLSEFIQLYYDFLSNIEKLKAKIKTDLQNKSEKTKPIGYQHYYMFFAPLDNPID